MRRSALLLSVLGLLGPASALGQTAGDKATAEALFGDGRKLMAQGNFREACPKFEASLRLDPGVGAMLNLADCFEKNGQTASAWAEFREAISAARSAGSKDREQLARQRAAALEPKLSRLTIAAGKQSVQVTRDGTAVDPAALGTPMPVDPGRHLIEATAAGKQKWSKTIEVGANAARVSLDVPALQDDHSIATPQPPTAPSTTPPTTGGPATDTGTGPSDGSTQRTIGIGAGAVGVVGIAAGAFFGLKASSSWTKAKNDCTAYPLGCGSQAESDKSDASSSATLSTVAFVVGGVALASGAVLWFTAPHATESETKVSFGVGPNGVVVRGGF